MIEGLLPIIPTPFAEGVFDRPSMERFLNHFLPWVDGYTILGGVGEAPSLTLRERMEIAAFALEVTPPDKTVVVGVSHSSVNECISLAQHAESIGARGVLCGLPYYYENTDEGVLRFLRLLDKAIGIELVLYDNPVPSHTPLDAGQVTRWAGELSHLHTVKLTDHDLTKIDVWHEAGLGVIAGDDPIAFQYLAGGVDGAMIIVPSIYPEAFANVWRLSADGRLDEAYEVFASQILPLTHLFGIGDETATSKAILQAMGIFSSAEVLPPLVEVTPARRQLVELGHHVAERHSSGSGTGRAGSTAPVWEGASS